MVIKLSARTVFSIIAIICTALLTAAYYLQYGSQLQQPCPLCILQRYAYMLIGAAALVGAIHAPSRRGGMIYNSLIASIASIGAGFAIWQLSKGHAMQSCLADPIGQFVNGLPMANWWPEYLFATGGCADVYPPILGLSLASWSLVWFAFFAITSSLLVLKAARRVAINANANASAKPNTTTTRPA